MLFTKVLNAAKAAVTEPDDAAPHSDGWVPYRTRRSITQRREEFRKLHARFPDKIPVICEPAPRSNITLRPGMKKTAKFLTDFDKPVHELLGAIRSRMRLLPEQSLFLLVNNSIVSSGDIMATLYERESSQDGFLYLTFTGENTFGSSAQRSART
jgi:GABA(A) receptor-associated protein